MILKAKHHVLIYPLLGFYGINKINRTFHAVHIKGSCSDNGLPILIVCNHISWWDGIWAYYVNHMLFKRKYFYMMKKEQLQKNRILRYAGGYSISAGKNDTIEAIEYTAELLSDKKNMVLLFPQGEIGSIHNHELKFKKGIEHILKRVKNEIQILFMANIIDYHSNVKPTVYSFLNRYEGKRTAADMQLTYNHYYKQILAELADITY